MIQAISSYFLPSQRKTYEQAIVNAIKEPFPKSVYNESIRFPFGPLKIYHYFLGRNTISKVFFQALDENLHDTKLRKYLGRNLGAFYDPSLLLVDLPNIVDSFFQMEDFTREQLMSHLKAYVIAGASLKPIVAEFKRRLESDPGNSAHFAFQLGYAIAKKEQIFVRGQGPQPPLWQRVKFFVCNFFLVRWCINSDLTVAKRALKTWVEKQSPEEKKNLLENYLNREGKSYSNGLFFSLWKESTDLKPDFTKKLAFALLNEGNVENMRTFFDKEKNFFSPEILFEMLKRSIELKDENMTRFFLEQKANPNFDPTFSLLGEACNKGFTSGFQLLLARGAEHNIKSGKDSSTLVHQAARLGRFEILQMLLALNPKPDVNAIDEKGATPLYYLLWANNIDPKTHLRLYRLLLAHGADLTVPYKVGENYYHLPLLSACSQKHVEILREAFRPFGCLQKALAEKNSIEAFGATLERLGKDPSELLDPKKNVRGENPLRVAFLMGDKELMGAMEKKMSPEEFGKAVASLREKYGDDNILIQEFFKKIIGH